MSGIPATPTAGTSTGAGITTPKRPRKPNIGNVDAFGVWVGGKPSDSTYDASINTEPYSQFCYRTGTSQNICANGSERIRNQVFTINNNV